MSFDTAMKFIDRWEGGFSDHPRDPGGSTNFGITQRVYHRFRRDRGLEVRPVREIDHDEVRTIYVNGYWIPAKCDSLPAPLALIVFDGSVNQGVRATARLLQVSVRVTVDGQVGPKTLGAIRVLWGANPSALIVELCARRARRYASTRNVKTFGLGWFRRLCDCERAALDLQGQRSIDA